MSDNSKNGKQLSTLKRAFLRIEELQARLDAAENQQSEPIAIVGLGCRYPGGVEDPAGLWRLLQAGTDAVGEIPQDRWDVEAHYDERPDIPGKMKVKNGAFLDQVDQFDPQFFGISPREAISMDPQQRLLLEVVWEALENAGIAADQLVQSRTGVFLGLCKAEYGQMLVKLNDQTRLDAYYASGNACSIASGRISYILGLRGPSITVDTACSSSLVAAHLACKSLRTGESNMAIVGGVSLILSPEITISYSQSSMLATKGRCRTFDAAADGFIQGEGCGIIILKRLSQALSDGDDIRAIIRGSAINQDGASSGLTAPSGPSQEAVIDEALKDAGLMPSQVSYVEAHGTGTPLGDPIEVQALAKAYGKGRAKDNPLLIGSLKSNLGHLEAAAGVSGLIKVVLSLQHREIPPSLHFKQPNPFIPWDRLPVKVVKKLMSWNNTSLISGVSSFGFSGTNAHVLIEEAPFPTARERQDERSHHILTLSAQSDAALNELSQRYADRLNSAADSELTDICYSANAGRSQLSVRLALTAKTADEMKGKLKSFAEGESVPGLRSGHVEVDERPRIVFLFTGQGSQYDGMGRHLYETQPVFRETLRQCEELLRPHLDRPLLSILYPEPRQEVSYIDQTVYTQPALFAFEYALAKMWMSWGIEASALMGHSVGEYVAACLAGVFTLEDGLKLIAMRGRLMQSLTSKGKMAAIFADEDEVVNVIEPYGNRISVAAFNGRENVVISGGEEAVTRVMEDFDRREIKHKTLQAQHGFHSALMEPVLDEFEQVVSEVSLSNPRINIVSNVTGELESGEMFAQPSYWRRHIREAVQFAKGIAALQKKGHHLFLEIGPRPTLLGMASKCWSPDSGGEPTLVPSLRKDKGEWKILLDSLATLYTEGLGIDWKAFDHHFAPRRVVLPNYPFQRKRYWADFSSRRSYENVATNGRTSDGERVHPLLGRQLQTPLIDNILFESTVSVDTFPFLEDHQVFDSIVFPLTGYLEVISVAAKQAFGPRAHVIEGMDIREALQLSRDDVRTLQLVLTPVDKNYATFELISFQLTGQNGSSHYCTHAAGKIQIVESSHPVEPEDWPALDKLKTLCKEELSADEYYQQIQKMGMGIGPSFQGLQALWKGKNQALAQIRLPEELSHEPRNYTAHPALLDSCLQFVGLIMAENGSQLATDLYMPIGVAHYRIYETLGEELWSHVTTAKVDSKSDQTKVFDYRVFDSSGKIVAELLGLEMKKVDSSTLKQPASAGIHDLLYEIAWEPKALEGDHGSLARSDFIPRPSEITTLLNSQVAQLASELNMEIYDDLMPRLDALSIAYVLRSFEQLGFEFKTGERFSTDQMAKQLGVVNQHHRLLNRLLEMLEEDEIIIRLKGEWKVLKTPTPQEPSDLSTACTQDFPEHTAERTLVERGGENLAKVLLGKQDPLQVLFPGGSFEIAHNLYRESSPAKFYNGLTRQALSSIIEKLPHDRTIRVLEVGAGTGGTTSFILDAFPPERTEYVFTDLSQVFLSNAQENFKKYPFVKYQILDLEQELDGQNFSPNDFDLIIAANVVHATKDLRETIGHINSLLAPGGMLLLMEGMMKQRWIDLTFGLTDGWWRFTDLDKRPKYTLLPLQKWLPFLREMGFKEVDAVPGESERVALTQNAVICARKPMHATLPQSGEEDANWLIFTDKGEIGRNFAEQLHARGEKYVLVSTSDDYKQVDSRQIQMDPEKAADYERLFDEVLSESSRPLRGLIHLWSIDDTSDNLAKSEDIGKAQRVGTQSLFYLSRSLAKKEILQSAGLWVVTRGAQSVLSTDESVNVAHSTIWGLGRTLAREHPELNCVRVDLDSTGSNDNVGFLVDEVFADDSEDQVSFRANERFVARLIRSSVKSHGQGNGAESPNGLNGGTAKPKADSRSVALQLVTPGLDGLQLVSSQRRAPRPNEIEIRVRATGLNFRDVLNALGMRADGDALGGECVGTVVRVGDEVRDLSVGDDVIVITEGGFSTFLTTGTELVIRKPESLSFAEAATLPVAFLTADYALHAVGGLKEGERVLIHAAAGGVGMAAVQLAQRAGAEIFATAGSEEKRAFLRSLGIKHVMDSRTLDFADEVRENTSGEGVDIVLNSLTGEAIPRSLALLREDGRFLEIGKKEIWDEGQIAKISDRIKYEAIDLAEKIAETPKAVRPLFLDLIGRAANGTIEPLPLKEFALYEVSDAFRYMAQVKHIGKVVVTQETSGRESDGKSNSNTLFHEDGSYLITGGLSGLGLLVAQWMAEQGARNLALMGRTKPSKETRATLEELRAQGVKTTVIQGDVSKQQDVEQALKKIEKSGATLRGIVHSAGVLDDGVLLQQSWKRFETVMAPKVAGAWNLHCATTNQPLDFFVLFSSMASVLGSPAQGNHAAANAFLDSLAHHRRAQGLPGLSINWGPWAEVGAGARHEVDQRFAVKGLQSFSPQDGLQVLGLLMRQNRPQIGVIAAEWSAFNGAGSMDGPKKFFEKLTAEVQRPKRRDKAELHHAADFRGALDEAPPAKRKKLLLEHVEKQAARVLVLDSDQAIDEKQPLTDLGLDSLMAVELRNVLSTSLGMKRALPASLVFDYPTIMALADFLFEELLHVNPAKALAIEESKPQDILEKVEELSEEEIDRLFAEKVGEK